MRNPVPSPGSRRKPQKNRAAGMMPAALGLRYCMNLCRTSPPAGGRKAKKVEAVKKYGFTRIAIPGGGDVMHGTILTGVIAVQTS
ncbi:hypothetical protein KL86DPRO_20470 [uncultured delta proteobacterium]|uniref:Uncharacterized protein n=1 Tax=uncultured delta proteobacterium TaxID=34034 RepID=A0A212K103_9DELT|nr:hypothetical protein KL86DPRO_20470 [uncultured delta proteobacterium]